MPDSALPAHLRGQLHWDWPGPFRKIPRGWTAFKWGTPRLLAGNLWPVDFKQLVGLPAPFPITSRGTWQLSYFPGAPCFLVGLYFAFTLRNGWHFRIGARWDDVDNYVQWPTIARRHYTGEAIQDTSV